ncbi:hypothetical protein K488DRAFT_87075 [Vararia minispora EC-137]|uniref:Uncharacterized protein n=1 Tax=Vararia minispora EC-137 TaxID=1314806 RepID=A0ACB8QH69_9AGAM|nr:hypothetical protein K488DRAFT_87075 [Vararia minispora EC-137]
MRRTSSHPSVLDYSIDGDEHERSRIQLEHNLQNTDLSLHLSSAHDDDYSIEFPRHNSGPQPSFSAFRSIDRSHDDFDPEEGISHLNAWSYRTGDDDEGITPFVHGETLSTAAHHASALTLSAGLGGRGARRDMSLSGAEYDPERPLQDLIANVNNKLSMLDVDETRSRLQSAHFDPSVATVDHILSSRQTRGGAACLHSPPSVSSSSSSEPQTPPATSPRPTLAEALNQLAFSPKRPRSPAHGRSVSAGLGHNRSHAPRSSHRQTPPDERRAAPRAPSPTQDNGVTPRPRKIHQGQKNRRAHGPPQQPEITVRPPTPSTDNSKFTKLARDLAREIEYEQDLWHTQGAGAHGDGSLIAAHSTLKSSRSKHGGSGYANKSGRHLDLPDVTGLTAAVESPARASMRYFPYKDDGRHEAEGKARLTEMLGLVQSRLAHLEGENNSSRRHMRELERELDMCKAEVAVERERMTKREAEFSREKDELRRHFDVAQKSGKDARIANDDSHRRYKEAVEEKKALESLIATLRSHMARLTDELAAQKSALNELRGMREADAVTLHEKVMEVDRLRKEVEKIAGEVEVLRGVVEDGLRERRARHERSPSPEPTPQSVANESEEEEGGDEEDGAEEEEHRQCERTVDESLYVSRDAPPQPEQTRTALLDRTVTMRTDRATLGSSPVPNSTTQPFIDQTEIERIAEELEERRSQTSRLSSSQRSSASRPPSAASSVSGSERSGSRSRSRLAALREESSLASPSRSSSRASTPAPGTDDRPQLDPLEPAPQPPRPSSRLHKHAHKRPEPLPEDSPFPQIRGERLERLFFSAPEHNTKTCTVCRRRRRPDAETEKMEQPVWYTSRLGRFANNKKGKRAENVNVQDAEDYQAQAGPSHKADALGHVSPNLDFLDPGTPADRLPPQTVLVKVLRELEDDFTHYKGIYLELAHQYGLMDPVSNVVKRNVLAEHLREVIDVLEQRGDQIASLYDLLSFEDKPLPSSSEAKSRSDPLARAFGNGNGRRRQA